MDAVWQDTRYAMRALARRPLFAAVAALTLALGVGASTAVFSVVDGVLLMTPPFSDPARLFILSRTAPSQRAGDVGVWSYPDFEQLREQTRAFDVAAFAARAAALTGAGEPVRAQAEMVSNDYFALLGVPATLGRTFAREEAARPLVLGHELWRTRFGGAPDVIRRGVALDGVAFEIVGVAPRGFRGQSGSADVWIPITDAPAVMNDGRRLTRVFANWTYVIARLRPDASQAAASAELDVIASRLRTLREEEGPGARGIGMLPLAQASTEPQLRRTLLLLLGAAGLVLLLACANLANLLLARAVERSREVALRRALGARHGRLVQQFLTESTLLGLLGGLAGLAVAWAGVRLLVLVRPDQPAGVDALRMGVDLSTIGLDGRVLAFNFLAALCAALLFGLAPVLQLGKGRLAGMHERAGTAPALSLRGSAGRSRALLAGSQIAVAAILLTGAGLLIESLVRLRQVDVGFRSEQVLTVGLRLPPQKYGGPQSAEFYDRLVQRVGALPGIARAAVATSLPVSRNAGATLVVVEGRAMREGEEALGTGYHLVSEGYFDALGIRVLRGRSFDDRDRTGAPRVAILNRTAAQLFFGDAEPLGRRIWLGAGYGPEDDLAEVVGVVDDVKYGAIEEPARPHAYLAAPQYMEDAAFLVVRLAGSSAAGVVAALRAEVAALDPALPLFDVQTMAARLRAATARTSFSATLLGIFAVIALGLAAVGVYGVMSFSVAARTREIGVRRALGASDRKVVMQVMREGVIVALLGLAGGVVGALSATRLLHAQLFEVRPADPLVLVSGATVLLAAALLAAYLPSRRAARVTPMEALRGE